MDVPIDWRWVALGFALRVALSPLQHTWDSQTVWNVLAQLGREGNPFTAIGIPYEQMRQLSDLSHGSGFRPYYEYWAYPPGMLLVWWPMARAWFLTMGPLVDHISSPDAFTAMPIPPILSLAIKLPTFVADLITAVLLSRLAGPSVGRWYWLNPYVLLASIWTFDGVMVALLLGGLVAALRQRWWLSGVLLGLGTGVKFVPALLVPVVVLWAIRHAGRPLHAALAVAGGACIAFGLTVAPWWDGLLYIVQFHGSRPGGGMSWQGVWGAIAWIDPFADLATEYAYLSSAIGLLTLGTALMLATWLAWLRHLYLLRMSLVVLLAYLAGSKLVNEVYPLPAVALAAVLLAESWSPGRARLLLFLWLTPLLFAMLNVPGWAFLISPAEVLGLTDLPTARLFESGYVLTYQYLAPILALVGALFQLGCIAGTWSLLRPIGRAELREMVGAAA